MLEKQAGKHAATDDTLKQRIPLRKEAWALFLVCMLPVHLRAYLAFFYALPSYIKYVTSWGIWGTFSYIQLFALVESVLIFVFLLIVNISLPKRFFREKFLPQGIVFLLVIFVWIFPLHYQQEIFDLDLRLRYLLSFFWLLSIAAAIFYSSRALRRSVKFERLVLAFGERVEMLGLLFFGIDILAFVTVAVRLIF